MTLEYVITFQVKDGSKLADIHGIFRSISLGRFTVENRYCAWCAAVEL